MSSLDVTSSLAAADATRLSRRVAPALYVATLFVSALLLFIVQPMFTKMVLPRLGGSPSVWSVAMVAFQTFLFAGYAYAHLVSRLLKPAQAAVLHLAFLSLVALTLPLGVASGFGVPAADHVMLWLVGLFAFSIGVPFIALSATAPLLQHWFVATGHPKNPYVLYAASNLGSFCALLAYPFAIEPFFSLRTQTLLWSLGFSLLALCIGAAACLAATGTAFIHTTAEGERPTWRQRAAWPLLTAIPAGLCIAVTSFIATDLAAAPFLWVVPLALYLLTFVAVFRDRPWISHALVLRILPYVLAPLAISVFGGVKTYWFASVLLNLIAFTLIALACHGEAYRLRPAATRLTEFYLWTSFGGVLGGVFAGIAAPHLFNYTYEYPILIVAALAVLPGLFAGGARHFVREAAPGLIAAAIALALWLVISARLPLAAEKPMQVALVVLAALMLFQAKRPARFREPCRICVPADRAVAARPGPGRNLSQLLRRASGGGHFRRHSSPAFQWHHYPRRRAYPRRSRTITARATGTPGLLLISAARYRRPSRPRVARSIISTRSRSSAWHRQPRLSQARW